MSEPSLEPGQPSIFALSRTHPAAFPVLIVAAWMLNLIGVGIVMQIIFHEFGHATAAWLSGRWAFPIPIAALTFYGESRTTFMTLLVLAFLGWVLTRSFQKRYPGPFVLSVVGLLIAADFAFLVADKDVDMWCIYAGVAGEIILPALVCCFFFLRLTETFRWEFWRYPVVLGAAVSWMRSFSLWSGISLGLSGWRIGDDSALSHDPKAFIEWLANTPGGNDQDCYRLVHNFGWTTQQLFENYRALCVVTALMILIGYGLSLVKRSL